MNPPPPPVLDYQSSQTPDIPQRRLAAQTARTTGIVSTGVAFFILLWWGVLFLGDWGKSTRVPENQTIVIMFGLYTLTYLLSGLLAYYGGTRIRTPRPILEHVIVVVTRVQITFACCAASVGVYAMLRTPHRDVFWISAVFVAIHLLILWRLMLTVRRIRVL